MNPTLPLPPADYNQRWAADLVRVAQAVVDDLARQAGIGYRVQSYTPSRRLAGNTTSCVGEVGTVLVLTNGASSVNVPVSGVGGDGADPTIAELANVLATLIADFRGKGTLG